MQRNAQPLRPKIRSTPLQNHFRTERTVAVDAPVRPVAGDPGVELAVADVALEAVLVVDLSLAEHLIAVNGERERGFRAHHPPCLRFSPIP